MSDEVKVEIADHPENNRYEMHHDGELVGVVNYSLGDDGVMVIPHVEVAPRLRGQGRSGWFLDEVLAEIHDRGLKVVPTCGYASAHIRSRPDLTHLLA